MIYITIITVTNILGIFIFCKKDPNIKAHFKSNNISEAKESLFITILKASKYLIYLIIGYILGEIININITSFINDIVFVMLLLLMLIIGGLLRFENI
ncbi:hypothetical protein [Francisella orientalis]|uniref:hypothetical protein n=1 Tax=Francisella orientalis TaxID=299583 RepID=UPI0002E8A59C|nr:hypothetical protein [Francisella orientalis]